MYKHKNVTKINVTESCEMFLFLFLNVHETRSVVVHLKINVNM